MQSDVERRLRSFIGEYFLAQEAPWAESGEASLRACGIILNDVELLDLIGFLEKAFGIAVLDDEIHPENLDTIHALTAYVDRKAAQALADVAQALANVASGNSRGSLGACNPPLEPRTIASWP
jgi:acyl carrier protein